MPYPNILRAVFDRPWAILPARMEALIEVLQLRQAGGRFTDDEIRERLVAAAQGTGPRAGGQGGQIAVLPVYGVLSNRMNMMSEMSGGTSVQQLRGSFRQALSDPSVAGIVLDCDSPGGSMDGIPELAAEIRASRGQKPIVAVSDTLCASACYWLASQCDEIIASPSSLTGSVGVYMAHMDESAANESEGVKVTYVYAGAHKVDGNPDEPLSDDARERMQAVCDAAYDMFTGDVAKGRGTSKSAVRSAAYGEGACLMPEEALAAGMVDRIGTLDDAFARISRGKVTMRAEADWLDVTTFGDKQRVEVNAATGEVAETPFDEPSEDHRLALARARARTRSSALTAR